MVIHDERPDNIYYRRMEKQMTEMEDFGSPRRCSSVETLKLEVERQKTLVAAGYMRQGGGQTWSWSRLGDTTTGARAKTVLGADGCVDPLGGSRCGRGVSILDERPLDRRRFL